jgi:hypothetical protein
VTGRPEERLSPFARLGQAAGAAIVRELTDRVEAAEEAVRENLPLDRAAERQIAALERMLLPLLEAAAAGRVLPPPRREPEGITDL